MQCNRFPQDELYKTKSYLGRPRAINVYLIFIISPISTIMSLRENNELQKKVIKVYMHDIVYNMIHINTNK